MGWRRAVPVYPVFEKKGEIMNDLIVTVSAHPFGFILAVAGIAVPALFFAGMIFDLVQMIVRWTTTKEK